METLNVLHTEKTRILKTNDYTLFRCNDVLRLNKKHLDSLIIGMTDKNLSKDLPIIIDINYNVLDGRYRFHANQKLKAPIYYKVAEVGNLIDFAVAKDLHLKMSIKDYAIFHSNNINYRRLLDQCNGFYFRFDSLVKFVSGINTLGRTNVYLKFKKGEFEYLKEYDYKFEIIDFTIKYFQDNVTKDYALELDDLDQILVNRYDGNWLKKSVIDICKDPTGYVKKWVFILESGYPFNWPFNTVLDEIDSLLYYGTIEPTKEYKQDGTYCGTTSPCDTLKNIDIVYNDLKSK